MTDIFETATRKKFRFLSNRGYLNAEQLWDLPLTSSDGFNLDTVARIINKDLKDISEESFVKPANTAGRKELEDTLEVVKRVIEVRQGEAKAREDAAIRASKRRKLLDAIAAKEDQELTQASKDDLLKQLAELD